MSVKTRQDEQELHDLKNSRVKLPDIQVSERYKGLKVLGLVADSSACGYYRVINPLHMLRMHGATVTYSTFHTADSFFTHDVIVVPRQHNPDVLEILKTASFDGKLLVYEIDDDLDSVDPSSPAYMVYHNGSPELRLIPEFMYTCHGVTVTTPELARWYYQNQQNVVVVENHIDYSFRNWGADVEWDQEGNPQIGLRPIEKPAHREGKISILWSGGSTHQLDLEEIGPSVRAILQKYPNVLFCFYGSSQMCQDFIRRYNLPVDQVEAVSPRHFLDYPEGLHGFDIGLAPIHCSQFNLCKSFLRLEEYGAVGLASIASNVGPYTRFAKRHPGLVSLVGKGKDCFPNWTVAMEYLIENPEERERRKTAIREVIAQNYALEFNYHQWPMAWEAIYQQRAKGIIGPPADKQDKSWYKSYGRAGRNDLCPCGSGLKTKDCCVDAWG